MSAVSPLFLKSVEQGAATQTYAAVRPELAGVSGQYFTHCNTGKPRADADDEALARELWDASERIIARLP
jgi:WW domain-containing oxidoreductase